MTRRQIIAFIFAITFSSQVCCNILADSINGQVLVLYVEVALFHVFKQFITFLANDDVIVFVFDMDYEVVEFTRIKTFRQGLYFIYSYISLDFETFHIA